MLSFKQKIMWRKIKGNVVMSEMDGKIKTDSFNTKYFVGKIDAMFCYVFRMTS